ncbi:MAG TPA: succinate dehydrogenase iron-sulfur subunit [Pirellulales bacterium]|jgi:succinate dehydrogenase / fumarate reductase iron-sulfur subunit|nr:succinate dehydrogenase iron-sulfur subunit [Pirellulales bacterium]
MTNAMTSEHNGKGHSETIEVRVLRQDGPGQPSYWQRHRIPHERDMNVISVLQRIAARAETIDGEKVAPVAWDCNCLEEVCGACTMVINGHVRQACSALVDRLLEENPEEIELRPMSKFPVVRDLVVNRGRMFEALKKLNCWIPVDGYYDLGPGPRVSPELQRESYPLSECMTCGCCLEACPQYAKIELQRHEGESDQQFEARENEAYRRAFVGPHAISQVMLFNSHPTGALNANERIDALTGEGGIQICGNAQNCVAVCPKRIPLTRSIGQAGWAATVRTVKWFFGRE